METAGRAVVEGALDPGPGGGDSGRGGGGGGGDGDRWRSITSRRSIDLAARSIYDWEEWEGQRMHASIPMQGIVNLMRNNN